MLNPLPKASSALAALHDIHLPTPLSASWLTPGWIGLLLTIVTGLLSGTYFIWRYRKQGLLKRQGLALLNVYQKQYLKEHNAQISSAHVSSVLKRVALAYYPRQEVAGLHGEAWLTFLTTTSHHVNFFELRHELLELPYQPTQQACLNTLFTYARIWIKQRRKPCLK